MNNVSDKPSMTFEETCFIVEPTDIVNVALRLYRENEKNDSRYKPHPLSILGNKIVGHE